MNDESRSFLCVIDWWKRRKRGKIYQMIEHLAEMKVNPFWYTTQNLLDGSSLEFLSTKHFFSSPSKLWHNLSNDGNQVGEFWMFGFDQMAKRRTKPVSAGKFRWFANLLNCKSTSSIFPPKFNETELREVSFFFLIWFWVNLNIAEKKTNQNNILFNLIWNV